MRHRIRKDRQIHISLESSRCRSAIAHQSFGSGEEDLARQLIDIYIHYLIGKQWIIFGRKMQELLLPVLAHQKHTSLSGTYPFPIGTIHGNGSDFFKFKQHRYISVLLQENIARIYAAIENLTGVIDNLHALVGTDPDLTVQVFGHAIDGG